MGFFWGGFESLILVYEFKVFIFFCLVVNFYFCGILFWVYIGLEDVEDLIVDLEVGFVCYN